jgi:CPA1 family monovalent cation:H+ antiporter
MALFESLLALLLVSILLLKISGHIGVPYPTMLAFAGACVAALPWAPNIEMEPRLALALFISPALLDAAYDLPPRELRRDWLPLTWLALIAVILTTAAVAWVGWAWEGMPLAAAIALGAIVAPPDAAAAAAVLTQFPLPRRTMAILQGESLLNDATALLIFTAAVAIATHQPARGSGASRRLTVWSLVTGHWSLVAGRWSLVAGRCRWSSHENQERLVRHRARVGAETARRDRKHHVWRPGVEAEE